MSRPPKVINFLNTLRKKVQIIEPEKLEERANAAVAKLSDSDLQYLIDDRRSLLDEAVIANNIYFVKALLGKKDFFPKHIAPEFFFHTEEINEEKLVMIKTLKSADFIVNISTHHVPEVGYLFRYVYFMSNNMLHKAQILVKLAIELLPKQLQQEHCEMLARFDEVGFIEIYEHREEIFTDAILKSIYFHAVQNTNLKLLDAKLFKVLSEKFMLEESKHILQILRTLTTKSSIQFNLQDAYLLDLIKKHVERILIFSKTTPPEKADSILNTMLNQVLITIYSSFLFIQSANDEKMKDKKEVNLLKLLQFVYELFARIEKSLDKSLASFVNFSEFFKIITDQIIPRLEEQGKFLSILYSKNSINQVPTMADAYIRSRTKAGEAAFLIRTICRRSYPDDIREKLGISQSIENNEIFLSKYADFFLKQLYLFAPELLVELMHFGNVEFNVYLYDRVNKIASEPGMPKPAIVMNALQAQKMWALHTPSSLEEQAKNPILADPKKQLPNDISKVILMYCKNSQSLMNLALSTKATRLKFFLKDEPKAELRAEKNSSDVLNIWNSYSVGVKKIISNVTFLLQELNKIDTQIKAQINILHTKQGSTFNIPSNTTIDEAKKEFIMTTQNTMNALQTEKNKICEKINIAFVDFANKHVPLTRQYISSYLMQPEALTRLSKHRLAMKHVSGFNGFFNARQEAKELLDKPMTNNDVNPLLKKQKI